MNKLKFALVAAIAVLTASAAYAGPHHWANGNWGNNHRSYAAQNGSGYGQGQGRYYHHSSYRGQGWGYHSQGQGRGYGLNPDGTCPYGYR